MLLLNKLFGLVDIVVYVFYEISEVFKIWFNSQKVLDIEFNYGIIEIVRVIADYVSFLKFINVIQSFFLCSGRMDYNRLTWQCHESSNLSSLVQHKFQAEAT
jgi:hypothetical protein